MSRSRSIRATFMKRALRGGIEKEDNIYWLRIAAIDDPGDAGAACSAAVDLVSSSGLGFNKLRDDRSRSFARGLNLTRIRE